MLTDKSVLIHLSVSRPEMGCDQYEIMGGQQGLLYPATHKVHLMCVDACAVCVHVCLRRDWGHQRVFASKLPDVNLLLSAITASRVKEGAHTLPFIYRHTLSIQYHKVKMRFFMF